MRHFSILNLYLPPEIVTFIHFAVVSGDINVCTIHIIGVIQMITPMSSVIAEDPISRLMTIPAANEIVKFAEVPIEIYYITVTHD